MTLGKPRGLWQLLVREGFLEEVLLGLLWEEGWGVRQSQALRQKKWPVQRCREEPRARRLAGSSIKNGR